MTTSTVPTEDEVRGWLTSLSNWNRWGEGAAGLRGTLNLLTPASVAEAAKLVRTGDVVQCSLPIIYDPAGEGIDEHGHLIPEGSEWAQHFMCTPHTDVNEIGRRYAPMDGFLIQPHGQVITHLDAPAHCALNGTLFNGVSVHDAVTEQGAVQGGIELAVDGILGRGVLLDVAAARGVSSLGDREAVMPEDLERCEELQGIRVEAGDLLMIRTGYRGRELHATRKGPGYARPGIQAACLPWFRERDIALLSSDVPTDIMPHGYEALGLPVHTVGIWAIGLWLIDNLYLEKLSTKCADTGRYQFFLNVAPLLLHQGTGSPVTPLAIF